VRPAGEYVDTRDVQPLIDVAVRYGLIPTGFSADDLISPPHFARSARMPSTAASDVIFSEALAIGRMPLDDWLAHFAEDCVFLGSILAQPSAS